MCGIFGYIGNEQKGTQKVYEGLKRLDYRGYDSWGLGILKDSKIIVEKHAGKIPLLFPSLPESNIVVGHTRWATHGAVNELNAHPHFASDHTFVLAQNGIVENFEELKKLLIEKGYQFKTQTDTEIIVRLIEEKKKQFDTLQESIRQAFLELEGRNTIIVMATDGTVIGARNGSPLVIGKKTDTNDIYYSSDTLSFSHNADQVVVLENGQMISCTNGQLELTDIMSGQKKQINWEKIHVENGSSEKLGFPHFMLKEIHENPEVIQRVTEQDSELLKKLANKIQTSRRVYVIGSGTAGGSAAQTAFYLRLYGRIPVISLIGAEAYEYLPLITKDDLLIAPSQSGETADVLEILEPAKKKGVSIASYVNMQGSMITRLSDFKFMANAGPEICVMSTKVYASQITWGYLLAKAVQGKYEEGKKNLLDLVSASKKYLEDSTSIANLQTLAKKLISKPHIFMLGKGQNLQIIKEGMIKIIEGAYIHAHAMPAGDLKHYAITLMEKGVPVIIVISNDEVKKDVLNAVYEVKARGAEVVAFAPFSNEKFDEHILVPDIGETSAIMNIVPLQLLAYYMALELGHDIDKPRNIAKSVTVK